MFEKLKKRIEALDERWRYLTEWHTEGSNAVLEFYVRVIPRAADAERCSIFIHIPTKEGMWLEVGTGETEREIDIIEEADPVVNQVITTGQSRIISGRHQTEDQRKTADNQSGNTHKDILCVPLKSLDGKTIIGAVQLMNKRGNATFDDMDRESVEEVVHYLEVRLENIFFSIRPTNMAKIAFDAFYMVLVVALGILVFVGGLLAIYYFTFSSNF